MKLMICGKGGSGKSTVATLLAKEFAKNNKTVLVIDTDESNFGLHRQLGISLPQDFTEYFGGKNAALDRIMQTSPGFDYSFFEKKWSLSDIPSDYISEKNGIKLIAIGKIHEVGEGCACTMGIIAQQFISNLDLKSDEVVIIDTEAGIEHFGRAVEKDADAILMVIDPSYESLKLSEKVLELSNSINKPVYFIFNKVNDTNESIMYDTLGSKDRVIAALPSDSNISFAALKGEEFTDEYAEIKQLSKFLINNLHY